MFIDKDCHHLEIEYRINLTFVINDFQLSTVIIYHTNKQKLDIQLSQEIEDILKLMDFCLLLIDLKKIYARDAVMSASKRAIQNNRSNSRRISW